MLNRSEKKIKLRVKMSHNESSNRNDSGNKCNVCKQPAHTMCSACKLINYCSKEHQKLDWKSHKTFCTPYMIKEDEILGRHLVATRDIKGGDVIIKEAPLLWGPTESMIPLCLGCGRGLSQREHTPCQKCGWPMCSDNCLNAPSHLAECFYTANRGEKVHIDVFDEPNSNYNYITTLRCLYNKQFVPEIWSKMKTLQSHCGERKNTITHKQGRIMFAAFIKILFKLDADEDTVLKMFGIININAFEVPPEYPPILAIYHMASMLEHNCKPNCCKTFTAEREIIIIAGAQGIKKGEHLSICYTDQFWDTIKRRRDLHETKYFWCHCQRCCDVTEFGTFLSCIKCTNKSCEGTSSPKSFLQVGLPWECNKCHKVTSYKEVNKLLKNLGKKKEQMQKESISVAKAFIKQAEISLPSTHYYIYETKYNLADLVEQVTDGGGLTQLCDDDLMLHLNICKDLLTHLEAIAPAENQIRAVLQFKMHRTIIELAERKENKGEEGPNHLYLSLVESKLLLLQVIEALKHESILIAAEVCQAARLDLKCIENLSGP